MQVHGYAAFKPGPQTRTVTSSAHLVRMNEHILELHLDYLRDLEKGVTNQSPAIAVSENQRSPGTLKRRLPIDFDENQRRNLRSRPSRSFPQPHGQAVNPSDDEDVSDFLPNDDDDDSESASNKDDSTSEADSEDADNKSTTVDRNSHADDDTTRKEQSDPMNYVVLLVTRLSGKLNLVNQPGKGGELAERRNQLWEAFQLYRPELFNASTQPRRLELLLDEVLSGSGAIAFHTRHKQTFLGLFAAPPTKIFAVGTAVDGYITDPFNLRLLVRLMPQHEWVLCLAVPVDHKRKDVRTLFSSINWPVRWGSWTFQLLIETAERLKAGVRPAKVDARARELLSIWNTISVGKKG